MRLSCSVMKSPVRKYGFHIICRMKYTNRRNIVHLYFSVWITVLLSNSLFHGSLVNIVCSLALILNVLNSAVMKMCVDSNFCWKMLGSCQEDEKFFILVHVLTTEYLPYCRWGLFFVWNFAKNIIQRSKCHWTIEFIV